MTRPAHPYLTTRLAGWLTLNGQPLAATGPELAAGVPTVLSGAKVNWGRSTTVDQPGPSTAAFTVANVPGGPTGWLEALEIGARVDLWASGVFQGGLGDNTLTDPGFETWPVGPLPTSGPLAQVVAGTASVVTAPVSGGARAVSSIAPAPGRGATSVIRIPPAPFSADRTAWDHIRTLVTGESAWLSYAVRAPAGAQYTVAAWAYQSPSGQQGTRLDGAQTRVGTGDWELVTGGQFTVASPAADVTGWWGGLELTWHPQAWRDMPLGQSWADTAGSWADYGHLELDDVGLAYATLTPTRDVLAFTGRITDVAMRMDASNMVQVDIIAADPLAELANVVIGDDPWPVESLAARVGRIMALAAAPGVGYQVDSPAAARSVTWRDVDRQAAAGLVQELAASSAAVAWMATHSTSGGPYFYLEDPSTRRVGLYTLQMSDEGLVVIISASSAGVFTELSATRVVRDPVRWAKSVADVTTALDLTWLEQTVDDKGKPQPTERHVAIQAAQPELDLYGWRRVSLSTQLASAADGQAVADLLFARLVVPGWRLSGLSWDTSVGLEWSDDDTTLVLDLLDGQSPPRPPADGHPSPPLVPDHPGPAPGVCGGRDLHL